MILKRTLLSSSILLSSCGLMPGMQNIKVSHIDTVVPAEQVLIHPVLIPITPALLLNQEIRLYCYRIAPSDVLSINVWQHPEFNFMEYSNAGLSSSPGIQGAAGHAGYLVNTHGDIYFPLIGYVQVAGKTMDEVREYITVHLNKYIKNPQVNVRVADYRGQKVYVFGEVMRPGFVPITDQPLTIADALTLSGSFNPDSADTRAIFVIRGNPIEPQIYWLNARTADRMLLAEQFSLQPRDILYVSSAPATRWNRMLAQLLPTVQTVWYTQAVVKNS